MPQSFDFSEDPGSYRHMKAITLNDTNQVFGTGTDQANPETWCKAFYVYGNGAAGVDCTLSFLDVDGNIQTVSVGGKTGQLFPIAARGFRSTGSSFVDVRALK
jgi:hypothetical protein